MSKAFLIKICIMAGNLNNANDDNRDVLEVIKRYLKDVVEKDGYFTGWIDEEVKRVFARVRSGWINIF